MRNSIRQRLTSAFIGLAVGPLLLVGVVLAWQTFTTQQQQALDLQHEVAQRVSTQVRAFFEELENELRVVSQVQGLQNLDQDRQHSVLSELLAYQDVFEELILFDSQGQEQIHLTRLGLTTNSANRAGTDEFVIPQTSGEIYYSPVRFEETTGEPLITIAVPLVDVRTGLVDGILVADARIKKIWNLIANVRLSPGQSVYIVDAQDKVVAHRNPSVVLRGTSFNVPDQDGLQPGLSGSTTVLAVETVRLGPQEFNIVVEQTWFEALALVINAMYIIVAITVGSLIVAGVLGFLAMRQIVRPIQAMATTAEAISAGDLSQQVKVARQDELGVLGKAFNSMTAQLRELIDSLEQRVADRTHRLEILASLGAQFSSILNLDELLPRVVNQIKDNFGYYHAHIYLLDEGRQKLVVVAGTGEAGVKMKASGHHIPLDTPTSLVVRAARSGDAVMIDDVHNVVDWLPNPLLPETRSEMAVPIILDEVVVGVLDVQSDRVAGLDEGDANLLRSIANQVAVAIRNARQFQEVENALAKARAAQERYTEQAWQKLKIISRRGQYHYTRADAPDLDQTTLTQAKQEALAHERAAVIALDGDGSTNKTNAQKPLSIVAPVTLYQKAIGTLQLHPASADSQSWSEDDLAIVEAVLDELAQTAENLRLFEETRQKASQEQTIREITDKMRATTSLNQLVETVAEELGQRLSMKYTFVELGVDQEEPRSIDLTNG